MRKDHELTMRFVRRNVVLYLTGLMSLELCRLKKRRIWPLSED